MDRTRPMLLQCLKMIRRAVAFILLKVILRIHLCILIHHPVPRHLCDDTGRRDGQTPPIPLDDSCLPDRKLRKRLGREGLRLPVGKVRPAEAVFDLPHDRLAVQTDDGGVLMTAGNYWVCPKCKTRNPKSKVECKECGTIRP